MILNPDQCYQALLTRDPRFDGRFFVAVKSTGIYCRPICRVKAPQRKNCTFYTHEAEAEVAGYRPCKRCRPELAPGHSLMEVASRLARDAAACIEQDFLAEHSLEQLAVRLGVTDRQVRKVFQAEFGVAPIDYWQTRRLLLAKQLLTDSRLPVAQIALASGFQSLRRFNVALKERYRMTPTELRRGHLPKTHGEFSFRLSYRPPLDWKRLLDFLARRAIPQVETVRHNLYLRTVRLIRQDREHTGFLEVCPEPAENSIRVRLSDSLLPICAPILERIRQLFDLRADPAAINKILGPLAHPRPGLRVPGSFDGFEIAIRAILGQQISVLGATTLIGRLVAKFGIPIETPHSDLKYLFPTAQSLARAGAKEIAKVGLIQRRAETVLALAQVVARGELRLQPGNRVEGTLRQLQKIPGIGEWTAQYIAMRALSWPDAFPHTDLGLRKALRETNSKQILARSEAWRPWRAYAALHLWSTLEKKTK